MFIVLENTFAILMFIPISWLTLKHSLEKNIFYIFTKHP